MTEQNSEAKKPMSNGAPDPEDMLDIEVGESAPAPQSPGEVTAKATPAPPSVAQEHLNAGVDNASLDITGVDITGVDITGVDITGVDEVEQQPLLPEPANEPRPLVNNILRQDTIRQDQLELSTTYPAVAQSAIGSATVVDEVDPWAREYQPTQQPSDDTPSENWLALIVRETLETVVLAVVIFLLIRVAIQNYRIEGSSMEPNFHNGEYLLVNKLAYRLGEYQRGDVIVFKYPGDTTKDYIKRVIGLPGDVVEIREGVLYVNEQMVDEPYATMPMNYMNEPSRIVEAGTLYVMGDNRPASSDTRDWGLLDQDLVIGQAWLAIFPLDTFGLVDHPDLHFTPGMAQGP